MFQLKALSKSALSSRHPNLQTVIGRSAVIEGSLVSQELVHLKGRVVGNIRVTGGLMRN
jgi:cytoskeletal protein CcmA (bactofilin family)